VTGLAEPSKFTKQFAGRSCCCGLLHGTYLC